MTISHCVSENRLFASYLLTYACPESHSEENGYLSSVPISHLCLSLPSLASGPITNSTRLERYFVF